MATYPSLPIAPGSDPEPIDDLEIDRAVNGSARARSFWSSDKFKMQVTHQFLTSAQKTTLVDFYTANKALAFDFVDSAGVTHSCLFVSRPRFQHHPGDRWTASVKLETV